MQKKSKTSKERDETYYICITVGISLMFIYYQNPRKEIDARQKMAGNSLDWRKSGFLENRVGPEGEFYMNGSKAGDVNPYFACVWLHWGFLAETKNCPITETEKKLLAGIWTGIPGFC